MPHFRPILIASISLTAAAAGMWGTAFDLTARGADLRTVILVPPAAVTLSVLAALLWLNRWQAGRDDRRAEQDRDRAEQDRDKAVLIRTLADVAPAVRRELTRTLPLPLRRVQ